MFNIVVQNYYWLLIFVNVKIELYFLLVITSDISVWQCLISDCETTVSCSYFHQFHPNLLHLCRDDIYPLAVGLSFFDQGHPLYQINE